MKGPRRAGSRSGFQLEVLWRRASRFRGRAVLPLSLMLCGLILWIPAGAGRGHGAVADKVWLYYERGGICARLDGRTHPSSCPVEGWAPLPNQVTPVQRLEDIRGRSWGELWATMDALRLCRPPVTQRSQHSCSISR